jgi:hypothetical protein
MSVMNNNENASMNNIFNSLQVPHASKSCTIRQYSNDIFVGKNKDGHASILFQNDIKGRNRIQKYGDVRLLLSQKVQEASVSDIKNSAQEAKFNILLLTSTDSGEIEAFFDIALQLFITPYGSNITQDLLIQKLSQIAQMLSKKSVRNYGDIAIQGCFAEFCVMKYLLDQGIDISHYYHSRTEDKFDFSITETNKIEVKSTLKEERIHHFNHTQLTDPQHNIQIASVLMRRDDKGMNLPELMQDVLSMLSDVDTGKLQNFRDDFLEHCERDSLDDQRYTLAYIMQRIKFFDANKVPHFDTTEPDGVTHTEYDVDFKGVSELQLNEVAGQPQ